MKFSKTQLRVTTIVLQYASDNNIRNEICAIYYTKNKYILGYTYNYYSILLTYGVLFP